MYQNFRENSECPFLYASADCASANTCCSWNPSRPILLLKDRVINGDFVIKDRVMKGCFMTKDRVIKRRFMTKDRVMKGCFMTKDRVIMGCL